MNAKLEIHRKFSILAWARRAQIWIDGREVAAIANGKTAGMEVPPGTHVIATKLGMTSGRPSTIEFAAGQTARLICEMSKGEMEPSGRTLTIIGMILGAVGFILNVGLIVTMLVLHISLF
jgi:hypothetical protein